MSVAAKCGSFVLDRLAFANSVVCAWDRSNGTVAAEIDKLHPRVTRISCSIEVVNPTYQCGCWNSLSTSRYAFELH